MREFLQALTAAGTPLPGPAYVAALAVKGTLWVGIAALVTLALRRGGAAARHLVWVLAVTGLLALPIATVVLPPLRGPWSHPVSRVVGTASAGEARSPAPSLQATAALPAGPGSSLVAERPAAPQPVVTVTAPEALGWQALVLPVWAAGVLIAAGWLALGMIRIVRLRRRARPVTDPAWLALCAAVAREMGVGRPVTLLRASGPVIPMTWGVRRAVVLVPADADHWTAPRRRDVLRHELAHVARYDCAIQFAAHVACAIHWFNPLAWLALRGLRIERERACDDRVLRAGARPSDYATHLLELARAFRAEAALAALPMARPSQLATRLRDVLDAGRRRSLPSARQVALAATVASCAMLALGAAAAERTAPTAAAAGRSLAGTTTTDAETAWASGGTAAVSAARTAAAYGAATVALADDTLPECVGETRRDGRQRSVHVNNGTAVTTTVGRCSLWFVAEGPVRFNDDFTAIAHIAPGGSVTLGTDNGEVRRELDVTVRSGALASRYRVNGEERPYDAEAGRWVAGALTVMFRSSGVAAEERARWIVQQHGIEGLIGELSELQGDHVRRRYAQVVLASDQLDAARLTQVLDWAGQSIDSDYELAQVLVTAARGPIDPAAQRAFVMAARSLGSDYERARVLSTALARADLDPQAAELALEIMRQMDSDYELARLLIQWQRGRGIDEALRPAFFAAVETLESDYERRRVLAAVAARRDASPAVVADVVAAAGRIGSDYDLAELLVGVAALHAVTAPLQPAFFAAVGSMDSEYDRGRVLRSLVEQPRLPEGLLVAVLRAAAGMEPGHERAEVLVAVASRHRLDEAARAAYRDAVEDLSDYDRERALRALDGAGRVGI